jgi:hypothetical protein
MVKRTMTAPNDEPEQRKFELPSEGEHQMQVVDLWTDKTDDNVVIVKLEVSEGDELGRSILHRVNLDSTWKGFFLTRLFLKAIGEPYKGEFETDEDMWIGKVFYATIIHNVGNNGKTYANIDQFNFDRVIKQVEFKKDDGKIPEEIAWDEK